MDVKILVSDDEPAICKLIFPQPYEVIAWSDSFWKPTTFVAFQYSLQMKNMLNNYFDKVTIDFVPLNMPPAFVYYCEKHLIEAMGGSVEE